MLNWNARNVKSLTGTEIWLFIIARVLVGFGLGVLGTRYFPEIAGPLGLPALVVGLLLFLVAGGWPGIRAHRLSSHTDSIQGTSDN
jgi:hypothetical protein